MGRSASRRRCMVWPKRPTRSSRALTHRLSRRGADAHKRGIEGSKARLDALAAARDGGLESAALERQGSGCSQRAKQGRGDDAAVRGRDPLHVERNHALCRKVGRVGHRTRIARAVTAVDFLRHGIGPRNRRRGGDHLLLLLLRFGDGFGQLFQPLHLLGRVGRLLQLRFFRLQLLELPFRGRHLLAPRCRPAAPGGAVISAPGRRRRPARARAGWPARGASRPRWHCA